MQPQRKRAIVLAAWTGIAINAVLALGKIFAGWWAGSLAVLGDGLDSSGDVVTSMITLFAAFIAARPADARYPYGYGRIEAVAAKAIAFVMCFVGAELCLHSIVALSEARRLPLPDTLAMLVMALSLLAKWWLSRYLFRVGQAQGSAMVRANAINMRSDCLLSLTVLGGLILGQWLQWPLLDPLLALAVGVWIIRSGFEVFLSSSAELMDGGVDTELYREVIDAAQAVPGVSNPHRVRARRLAELWVIDLDVEVDGDLTVREGHRLCRAVEEGIKARIDNVYDVLIHIEPRGNVERDEAFGLCTRQNLR